MPAVNRRSLSNLQERRGRLAELLAKVCDAPREWFNPAATPSLNGHVQRGGSVEAMACREFAEVEAAWGEALRLRQDLRDAVAVVLAVAASTSQSGNQLFLDLIGSPGSGKTTICQGLLASNQCVHLENVTKLLSGWHKPEDRKKDCSFLARANNKTWVTCEFDVLASSPEYHQLMGKIRRIFDGETSATYGNSDIDRLYTALRTPWIRAGTYSMMDRMADRDQSQLGDRFMRFIVSDPDSSERRQIALSALRSERLAMLDQVNGSASSIVDDKTRRAQALMGGYVDWLRANVEGLLPLVEVGPEAEERCLDLAELAADLRARPNEDRKKVDVHDSKELPTRLARQNIRLACCLAVVLNKRAVDREVIRIIRKVALDTAAGHSLNIATWLCSPNPRDEDGRTYQESGGIIEGLLESWLVMPRERLQRYLGFLKKVGVLEWREVRQTAGAWALTNRVHDLYRAVMRD